jgi:hypothetical protein
MADPFKRKNLSANPPNPWNSDDAKYQRLEVNPEVRNMEARLEWWDKTDEGWSDFSTIFSGPPVEVAKTQVESTASNFLSRFPIFVENQGRMNLIYEGLLRATASGYAIGIAPSILEGKKPDSSGIDSRSLADATAATFAEESEVEPSTTEWFGFANRNGITVFQWLLLPLGVSSVDTWKSAPTTELMALGRWHLRYGIALAKSQLIMTQ